MDLRDFEPARTDRRLNAETGQPPGLRHRVFFALVIAQLGAMSLVWNLLAPVLSLLLPRAAGGRLGRSGVSYIYRCCWTTAELLGLMKIDSKELDEIIKGLRKLDDESQYANPETVARLEQSVTDNIKRFEYTLRRRLDANASQVFLSGSDDVPEQYRKLVEQYYRSLSKGGGKQNP